MSPPTAYAFDRQRIVVAEEDAVTAATIVSTLRRDGHCITIVTGTLSISDPAIAQCQLLISSLRVGGVCRMDLLEELRECWPTLPMLFLAYEGPLPRHLPSLCVPFTAQELQAAVRRLLPALHSGTVLALQVNAAAEC